MDIDTLLSLVSKNVADTIPPYGIDIYALTGDRRLGEAGKKVDGAKWMSNTLGPPFQINLVWGQHFKQASLSLYSKMENVKATTVPIDLHQGPFVKKLKRRRKRDHKNYGGVRKRQNVVWLEPKGYS